jgi:hypothetical protein
MNLITLHDHLNHTQEVAVDADQISSVTPFGSGSAVVAGMVTVGVCETEAEIMQIIKESK